MTLHVRDALPAKPEIKSDRVPVYETVEREIYREQDGLLIETGRSVSVQRRVGWEEGPEYDTGSMIAQDLTCLDCGADLVPHDEREISFLICGRLNYPNALMRAGDQSRFLPYRVIADNGAETIEWKPVESEKPYPGCVLECGNWKGE